MGTIAERIEGSESPETASAVRDLEARKLARWSYGGFGLGVVASLGFTAYLVWDEDYQNLPILVFYLSWLPPLYLILGRRTARLGRARPREVEASPISDANLDDGRRLRGRPLRLGCPVGSPGSQSRSVPPEDDHGRRDGEGVPDKRPEVGGRSDPEAPNRRSAPRGEDPREPAPGPARTYSAPSKSTRKSPRIIGKSAAD